MTLTPAQVCNELAHEGRRVSLRRLKDWRDIGLLPKLTRRRRAIGRGGTVQVWEDDTLIERAARIHDLLEVDTQADAAYLGLWMLEYHMDLERACAIWLDSLSRVKVSAERIIAPDIDKSDAFAQIGKMARKRTAAMLVLPGASLLSLEPAIAELIFGTEDSFDPDDAGQCCRTVFDALLRAAGMELAGAGLPSYYFADLFDRLTSCFSISGMARLIREASASELLEARATWGRIRRIAERAAPEYFSQAAPGGRLSRGALFGVAFGRQTIPVLLQFPSLNRELGQVIDLLSSLDFGPHVLSSIRALMRTGGTGADGTQGIVEFASSLCAVLNGTDLATLLVGGLNRPSV